ncbi:hypothetical protein KY290_028538 [Solanum tuberosum]|uniref:Putative plant transposon protein domain-containing protein n=1 Tax=Solanum tuberosum TaxID=4113 RepID=A0ABQ7UI75_SOLTU|nr:hypothetical protein KY290_028538 [Solanum tuberosum]
MTREERILNGRVFDPDILTKFGMSNLSDDVSIQGWHHLFEPPVPYLHEPEVHEFFYKMEFMEGGGITTTVRNVDIYLDEEILGIILGVHVVGIRTIEGCKPSSDFTKHATKRGDVKCAGLPKKFLKGEYQLLFEFINKVLVPRTEKRTVTSAADLFLMEKLDALEEINLSALMLEHMHRVMTQRLAKHGIPYGYLLNFVFKHFKVPLGIGILNDKEVEIARLKSELQKAVSRGLGTSEGNEQVLQELRDENDRLLKTNASLSEEVKALNMQLIKAHEDANECMSMLMRTLIPLAPLS